MSAPRTVGADVPDAVEQAPPVAASRKPILVGPTEGYERWAASYDGFPNPLIAREERYLVPLLPDLCGKNALDLACGTGRWVQTFLARGARLAVGVDSSTAMLQVASCKTAIGRRLLRADCLQLPFRASIFDFVVCSFALGHIQDLERMARELARVMKPRAVAVVSDLHPQAYSRGWRTGFRDDRGACQIEVLPLAAEEIVQAFSSRGFECLTHVPLSLGDPERQICAEAGKGHVVAETVQPPAVLVCHFRRKRLEDLGAWS